MNSPQRKLLIVGNDEARTQLNYALRDQYATNNRERRAAGAST